MTLLSAGVIAWCCVSHGQELEISISPSPVGSGARAAGMADAFIAVADDATAASWNPAGLLQLERPEISIVGAYNALSERVEADLHPEFSSGQHSNNVDLNFLSFVYPSPFQFLGRDVCFALSYQRKFDFSRKLRLNYDQTAILAGVPLLTFLSADFEQEGSLGTISPSVGVGLLPRLSVGISINLWRSSLLGENSWEQDTTTTIFSASPAIQETRIETKEKYDDFSGENVTLGALWKATDRWNIGLRYQSEFTGDAEYSRMQTVTALRLRALGSGRGTFARSDSFHEKRELTFPESWGVGVAFRANDRLTLACDITRVDWNDFYFKDSSGHRFSLVNGASLDNPTTKPRFEVTHTVRLGAEYVLIPQHPEQEMKSLWTLRGGLFYDEEPASDDSRTAMFRKQDKGKPDRFYGCALGVGWLALNRVNIDLTYQLRYGNNVNHDFVRGIPGFEEDVVQHRLLLSTVVYF